MPWKDVSFYFLSRLFHTCSSHQIKQTQTFKTSAKKSFAGEYDRLWFIKIRFLCVEARRVLQSNSDSSHPVISFMEFFPSCFLSPRLLPFVLHVGLQPRIVEENLTYAELELIKPLPEMKAACSGTVYAQILFKEQKLWEQTTNGGGFSYLCWDCFVSRRLTREM